MTVIIFIIVLAILILVHEFGHFIAAKKSGMKVEEFGLGFPPKLFSWKPKGDETTYSINLIPFGGFVKILGENGEETITEGDDVERSFAKGSFLNRAKVLFAGVFFNFLLAWLFIAISLSIGVFASTDDYPGQVENPTLKITAVLPGSPAEEVGLKAGDDIISIKNSLELVMSPKLDDVRNLILNSDGEITLEIGRGNELLELSVLAEEGLAQDGKAIGIAMGEIGIIRMPFYQSIWEGLKNSLSLIVLIFLSLIEFFVSIISGGANINQITGPVGIAGMVGDAARLGLSSLFYFTALISLHLAVLNLLPFPALDGGRLLFLAIEKIKGSKVNQKIELWVNSVGFLILIILMIIVTWNDIVRLF